MFHHTHTYIATTLIDDEMPLLQFGSILPDLAITKIIPWSEGLHGVLEDQKFNQFIQKEYPEYVMLTYGVHLHNVIDIFSHLDYRKKGGYAYQNNQILTELIARFYELDSEKASEVAHNYIESAVDILLLKDKPEVQTKLRMAINQLDQEKLAEILAKYFRKDKQIMLKNLNDYINLITKYNSSQQSEWNLLWQDLEKLMKLKNIGEGKRTQLLNRAIEITRGTYKGFLEYAIETGRQKIIEES